MAVKKISESIEVSAPLEEVFRLVVSSDRRMQLHPSWGTEKITGISPHFPHPGSSYQSHPVDESQPPYETVVTDYQPNQFFAYQAKNERQKQAAWSLQNLGEVTRLTYEETYLPMEADGEEESLHIQQETRQWMTDIKRYLELPNSRAGRLFKWVLDAGFLQQRADQRRIILILIAIQLISLITYSMAAMGLGLARLIFF